MQYDSITVFKGKIMKLDEQNKNFNMTEEMNAPIFEKKLSSKPFGTKLIDFVVRNNLMTRNNAISMIETIKIYFDMFSLWISQLSWGKFIFFIILFNMISHMVLNQLNEGFLYKLFDSVTSIFIFGAIGVKIFFKNKIKAAAQVKEAQLIAEKEMLQRQLAEAKIQIMQAQIEPHFLFNTLSSLDYLIMTNQEQASKMLLSLVTYLRYALPQIRENQSFNALGKEIENIKAYLNIMEIRMGDRLQVNYDIDESIKNLQFPSMTLQPIVENAIKYGVEESIDGAVITISASQKDDNLEVCVADTGPGLEYSHTTNKKGNGMALNNIKNRLCMLYDNQASLMIMNNEPTGVIVKIIIPLKNNEVIP